MCSSWKDVLKVMIEIHHELKELSAVNILAKADVMATLVKGIDTEDKMADLVKRMVQCHSFFLIITGPVLSKWKFNLCIAFDLDNDNRIL